MKRIKKKRIFYEFDFTKGIEVHTDTSFTRSNYIIIIYMDDCLIFCKNNVVFKSLVDSLNKEFKLIDEGDLATFLGVLFNKISYNTLELTQLYLT